MKKFVLIVEFEVKPESRDVFLELIETNARASVANEPGCFQFDVCCGVEDSSRIVLYEVYQDEPAFKAHLAMPHTSAFLAAAKPLVIKQSSSKLIRLVAPAVKSS